MKSDLKFKTKQEITKIWLELFQCNPPAGLTKSYLIMQIDWQRKYGGLPKETQNQLDKLVVEYAKTQNLKDSDVKKVVRFEMTKGTKLIREFKGEKHEVIAIEKGFEYRKQKFKSLSAIANKITGTRWNGKKFFGVAK